MSYCILHDRHYFKNIHRHLKIVVEFDIIYGFFTLLLTYILNFSLHYVVEFKYIFVLHMMMIAFYSHIYLIFNCIMLWSLNIFLLHMMMTA
jgi:hypothetical protein